MEFSLDGFYNSLISYLGANFPFMEDEELDKSKHPKRSPLHLQDAVFNNLQAFHEQDTITFDIGNERLELTHPYYHILQQAEVIRKAGLGDKKSKGSQQYVRPQKRDYEKVEWNGKTFTKEYSRNVRGKRSLIGRATRYTKIINKYTGEVYVGKINRNADYYANIHYRYIDKILDTSLPFIAQEFGLKMRRKEDTGLTEEYLTQENDVIGNILNIFDSFNY